MKKLVSLLLILSNLSVALAGTARTIGFDFADGAGVTRQYVQNGNATKNTTGWATYADAAGTAPVDCTGGSATNTFTRSTSSPLRGDANFLITHSTTNRQGDGASYAFTIDRADQAKILTISFDYEVGSGTMSDTDQSLWIYDVTNSALIQPTPSAILNASGQVSKSATFQTASNSTSYRVCFHTSSTSTTAYTLKLGNIKISPVAQLVGASVSDYVLNTGFTYAGIGTIAGQTVSVRRIGDSLEVQGFVTSGTVASSVFSIILPSSLKIDTAKLGSNHQKLGYIDRLNSSGSFATSSYGPFPLFYDGSTNDRLFAQSDSGGTSTTYKKSNGDFILGSNGNSGSFRFTVPISGWGTSQVLSTETDTRIVSFQAVKSAGSATANTAIGSWTLVNKDTHSGFNSSTGEYTVPIAGDYVVDAIVNVTSGSPFVSVYKNGTAVMTCPVASAPLHYKLTNLVANDKITIAISASLTISTSTAPYLTSFGVERVSGPAQVSASEKVFLLYTNNGGQSITALTTNITWSTKVFDSHSAWNGTTFTAPYSGWYHIFGSARYTSNISVGVESYVNATRKYEMGDRSTTDVKNFAGGIYLLGGDQLTFRTNASPTLSNDTGSHWISITSQ